MYEVLYTIAFKILRFFRVVTNDTRVYTFAGMVPQCSTMKAKRLAALALMHAYRNIPTDVEAMIREFCTKKNRRLAFEFL